MVTAEIVITTIKEAETNYFYLFLIFFGLYLYSMILLIVRIEQCKTKDKQIKKLISKLKKETKK